MIEKTNTEDFIPMNTQETTDQLEHLKKSGAIITDSVLLDGNQLSINTDDNTYFFLKMDAGNVLEYGEDGAGRILEFKGDELEWGTEMNESDYYIKVYISKLKNGKSYMKIDINNADAIAKSE